MATRVILHLGDATSRCIFQNVQSQRTKFQVQNILKQNRNFRRIRNVEENVKSPIDCVPIQQIGPGAGKKLFKAAIFTGTFTGAAFLGATIWEYERVRSYTFSGLQRIPFHHHFRSTVKGWRGQVKEWWDSLSEGQRMFYFICYANAIVLLAWKIPKFQPFMLKYFTTNPASSVICMPLLLSIFSHYNLWHFAANMYVLHSFSTAAVAYLGREHFVAVYMSGGIIASFCSLAYKILLNRGGPSLGASGAIMTVLAFICTQYPETKLSIIFLPQLTFSAGVAIKSVMALDTVGCILGWKFFDHAAHLGGALFGLFWQKWGVENIWRKRAPVLTYWHEFRNGTRSN